MDGIEIYDSAIEIDKKEMQLDSAIKSKESELAKKLPGTHETLSPSPFSAAAQAGYITKPMKVSVPSSVLEAKKVLKKEITETKKKREVVLQEQKDAMLNSRVLDTEMENNSAAASNFVKQNKKRILADEKLRKTVISNLPAA